MNPLRTSVILVALCTLVSLPAHAVHVFELAGGIQVIAESDPAAPIMTLRIDLVGGSADDPNDKQGLAQVASRVLLETGTSLGEAGLRAALDNLGATVDRDVSQDLTSFSFELLPEAAEDVLGLVADMLAYGPPDNGMDKAKSQALSALEQSVGNDKRLAYVHFRRAVYGEHPFGRDPLGERAGIGAVSIDDVLGFWRTRVVSGNLVIRVSGPLPIATMKTVLAHHLGRIPQGPRYKSNIKPLAALAWRRTVVVDKPDRSQTQLYLGYPTIGRASADYAALQVALSVFGSFSGRFNKAIRIDRGWSYGAYSYAHPGVHPGLLTHYTFPKADKTAETVAELLRLLAAYTAQGPTEDEVTRAKRFLAGKFLLGFDTAAERVDHTTVAILSGLDPKWLDGWAAQLAAVKPEQVKAAAIKYMVPNTFGLAIVGDAKTLTPALGRLVPGLQVQTVPWK